MLRHLRAFGALLALLAFSASLAEGVWASTCAAMENRDPSSTMSMDQMDGAGPTAGMAMTSTSNDRTSSSAGDPQQDHRAGEDGTCPMVATMGACSAPSIPTPALAANLAYAIQVLPVGSGDSALDLLFVTPVLRPPRA